MERSSFHEVSQFIIAQAGNILFLNQEKIYTLSKPLQQAKKLSMWICMFASTCRVHKVSLRDGQRKDVSVENAIKFEELSFVRSN